MEHKECLERLCSAIRKFAEDRGMDTPPCFCGENWIARIEIEKGMFSMPKNVIEAVEKALEISK